MDSIKTRKEDDFVKWYHEVIEKTKLVDFSVVKGCVVYHDYCLRIWNEIKSFLNYKLAPLGFDEYYFPVLIPLNSFKKQEKHFEDFFKEVLVVSKAGHNNLDEEYVIRPTSESIIYESISKWVKEEKHLPLCINQYCSVMRWESFKPNMPLLRGNEFLWQESHSVHSSKKEADGYTKKILGIYKELHENYLAMPCIIGYKPQHRMFPGAEYTLALESLMPDLKSVQSATSHYLGQNFSKAFSIKFKNKKGKEEFAYQACNGITTRVIGAMVMLHGDNKGLVIPPGVAPYQVVFVGVKDSALQNELLKSGIRFFFDLNKKILSEKIEYWTLMGAPIIVTKDRKGFNLIRRDSSERKIAGKNNLVKEIQKALDSIQNSLYKKAKEFNKKSTSRANSWEQFREIALNNGGFIEASWCNNRDCAKGIREIRKYSARVINPSKPSKCIHCGNKAEYTAIFAPAY